MWRTRQDRFCVKPVVPRPLSPHLYFFDTDEIEEHVTFHMSKLSHLKASVPKLIHHLMGGGDIPVHTTCEPQIKQ